MGVTVFPTIKTYDVLKTHYFPLLRMTIVSYTASQISEYYNIAGLFVLNLDTKKDKIESYFLLHFQVNPIASIPSMDLCYPPSRSLHSY